MTVQSINLASLPRSEPVKKTDPWAILAVLALVRNTLAKGQQKMATSTERLIENGNKIQDKQLRDLKEMGKINLEAIKKALTSEKLKKIALGLTIAAIVIGLPAGGAALAKLGSSFAVSTGIKAGASLIAPALSTAAAGVQIGSEVAKMEAANKQIQVAEIQEHVSIDAGLTDTNTDRITFSGNTLTDAAKARVSVQRVITEIINSTGSAMQIAVR